MLSVSNQLDIAARANRAAELTGKAAEKLSSGLRINRASDDAGGLALSESMRTQVRGLQQAAKNIQDALNIVRIGEDGVGSSRDILQKIRTLVVQAANGTNDATSLAALQTDIDATKKLMVESFSVAVTFRAALDGIPNDRILDFQAGANEGETISVDYNGVRNALLNFIIPAYGYTEIFNDPAASSVATSQFGFPLPLPTDIVPPPPLFPPFPPGTTFDQAFPKQLNVNPNSAANIQQAFSICDNGLQNLELQETYLGASSNRLETALHNVLNAVENNAAAESRIRDADMAAEVTSLTRGQIASQSSTAMIAQSAAKQQAILTLLQGQ